MTVCRACLSGILHSQITAVVLLYDLKKIFKKYFVECFINKRWKLLCKNPLISERSFSTHFYGMSLENVTLSVTPLAGFIIHGITWQYYITH